MSMNWFTAMAHQIDELPTINRFRIHPHLVVAHGMEHKRVLMRMHNCPYFKTSVISSALRAFANNRRNMYLIADLKIDISMYDQFRLNVVISDVQSNTIIIFVPNIEEYYRINSVSDIWGNVTRHLLGNVFEKFTYSYDIILVQPWDLWMVTPGETQCLEFMRNILAYGSTFDMIQGLQSWKYIRDFDLI